VDAVVTAGRSMAGGTPIPELTPEPGGAPIPEPSGEGAR
jgi:hypothetical protein